MQSLISHAPGATAAASRRVVPRPSTALFDRPLAFRCAANNNSHNHTPVRHATHGAQGRANGPKNGAGKRLGAKKAGDEYVVTGNIIFRQRGTKWYAGENAGIGRDHTIFALRSGYVKYYRNPALHPKRQYIGVAFEKEHSLPAPANAPRRRRLDMIEVARKDLAQEGEVLVDVGVVGTLAAEDAGGAEVAATTTTTTVPPPIKLSKNEAREAARKRATGRLPVEELGLRPDYSYRESNYSIGRAAERAGVSVAQFRPGDRFAAWKRRNARIAKNAEKRAMGGKKGKKDKPSRGGSRAS